MKKNAKEDVAANRGGANTQPWVEVLDEVGDGKTNYLVPDVGPSSRNSMDRCKKWKGKLTLRYRGLDYLEALQTHPDASWSHCCG